jgi:beta-glucosidase
MDLLYRAGLAVGEESRIFFEKRGGIKGLMPFAPTIDMERDPRWGRTEEGYGEDPVLAGRLSSSYLRGLMGPDPARPLTIPVCKHFYANNNEEGRGSFNASVDERARHEYYLKPFEIAVREGGAMALMTSYNAVNGRPAILHPDIEDFARGRWGLDGFVVCDGGALKLLVEEHRHKGGYAAACAAAIKAGVDNFTDEAAIVEPALRKALAKGLVREADIDRALERVLACRSLLGQLDYDPGALTGDFDESLIHSAPRKALALEAARKAIVLLKNDPVGGGPLLPAKAEGLERVAVIGLLADPALRGWYSGFPAYHASPLQALAEMLPPGRVCYEEGLDLVSFSLLDGRPLKTKCFYDGSLVAADMGAGEAFALADWYPGNQTLRASSSGYYLSMASGRLAASAEDVWGWHVKERFSLEVEGGLSPEGSVCRIRAWNGDPLALKPDGRLEAVKGAEPEPLKARLVRDGIARARKAAERADYAFVFLGNHPLLGAKEEIDRQSVALPPRQEALAREVIMANPRTVLVIVGSYPYALGSLADEAAAIVYTAHGGQEGGRAIAEALFGGFSPAGRLSMSWPASDADLPSIFDYALREPGRTYLHSRAKPLFPFGHGLSYSRFSYSGLALKGGPMRDGASVEARLELCNEGPVAADEVVQLYARCLGSAVKRPRLELKDFARVSLKPGEAASVSLKVDADDLKVWLPDAGRWALERGEWEILVGASSEDIRLKGRMRVSGEALRPRTLRSWTKAASFDEGEAFMIGYEGGRSFVAARAPGAWIGFRLGPTRGDRVLELSLAPGSSDDIEVEGAQRLPETGSSFPKRKRSICYRVPERPEASMLRLFPRGGAKIVAARLASAASE